MLVEARDAEGETVERQYVDLWYDDGTTIDVAGAYAALMLDLQHRLHELGDDAARGKLLAKLRGLLDKGKEHR